MAPGGITFRFSSVSAKTYRVPGRHECLPYSKNATCSEINKHQFVGLPRLPGKQAAPSFEGAEGRLYSCSSQKGSAFWQPEQARGL